MTSRTVPQAEMAEWLSLTARGLRNLKDEVPPCGKEGTQVVYDLKASIQAYIKYKVEAGSGSALTKSAVANAKMRREVAMAVKEEALARSAQVAAAKDEGKVALIQDVKRFVGKNNERVKAKLLGQIPGKAAQLVGIKKAEDAKAILIGMCNTALGELAEWRDDEAAALDDDGDACDAGAED